VRWYGKTQLTDLEQARAKKTGLSSSSSFLLVQAAQLLSEDDKGDGAA
jgi:hypothetical protein